MRSRKASAAAAAKYAFLLLYALVIVVPLLFIVLSSFKDDEDIFMRPFSLPRVWHVEYYKEVWLRYDLYKYFLNSLYYTAVSVCLTVGICLLGAYAIARLKWRLKGLVFHYLLLGLMVPTHALVVPLYIMAVKLRLDDPRITVVLIMTATHITTTLFLLTGYLKKMPIEMEEAAVIDGCGIGGVFLRIAVPLMQPAVATAAIFAFLSVWNDFFIGLIFIDNQKNWTLQLGMSLFRGSLTVRYSHLLVAITIAILPAVALYALMNRRIIAGLTAGAVKA